MKNPVRSVCLLAGILAAGAAAQAQVFLIDFGPTLTSGNWTNVTNASSTPVAYSNLVTSTGATSAVSLTISADALLFTNAGTSGSNSAIGFAPLTATSDFITGANARIKISGLDPSYTYTFALVASRAATDRSADYTLSNGGRTAPLTVNFEAGNNTSNVLTLSSFAPSLGGVIDLTLLETNGNNFAYINALQITAIPSAVPEPSAFAALAGVGALGCASLRRRRRA